MRVALTTIFCLSLLGTAASALAQAPLRAAPLDPSLAAVPAPSAPGTPPASAAALRALLAQQLGARGDSSAFGMETLAGMTDAEMRKAFAIGSYLSEAGGSSGTSGGRSVLTASWEQAAIQGLTTLIVNNARASALAAAGDQVRQGLCESSGSNSLKPKQILSATCALALNSSSATVPMAWSTYKAAFEEDLGRLPDRMLRALAPGSQPEFRETLLTGLDLVRQVERGDDPVLMLGSLAHHVAAGGTAAQPCAATDRACVGVRALGTAVTVLAPVLHTRDPRAAAQQWLADSRYVDTVLVRYQEGIRRMPAHAGWTPSEDERVRIRLAFQQMAPLLAQLQTSGEAAAEAVADAERNADERARHFNQYADATVRIFGLMPSFLPGPEHTGKDPLRAALHVTDRASVALAHVRKRDYASAFVVVTQLVSADSLNTYFGTTPLPAWYTRYAPFVAEIASAQTPEAFQSALASTVAPMGSYRAKRERGLYFGVNAYAGLQGGVEKLRDVSLPASGEGLDDSGQIGLAVPVGVELGVGTGAFSLGVLGTILDLGNVARFRIDDDAGDDSVQVSDEPEYGLAQLVSPGLYLTVGLGRRLPASIGVGGSWTPALREVTGASAGAQKADVWRWGLFMGVDVPLYTF
jgi:hypothetical protein